MIQWLLRVFGLASVTSATHRRSIIARLHEPAERPESSVMVRAQAALDRHEVREEAIAQHQVTVDAEKAASDAQRQSAIHESTVMFDATVKKATTRRRRREPNLFDISQMARDEARRRREG